MMTEELKKLILENKHNCILVENDNIIMTSLEKGVAPLYNYIKDNKVLPSGEVKIADKIVGRAVAFLAIYLKAKFIYSKTISKTALDVLKDYDIEVDYDIVVPFILNRNKDGQCPMEKSLEGINSAEEAFNIIDKFKMRQLNK